MAHRKRKWIIVALVAALALGWWLRRHFEPPSGFILELAVVDADTAVITWRANYESNDSRGWISCVDAHGRTKWWHELPDVPFGELQVGKDMVAVRYTHDGRDQALIAFSLVDGTQLWDRVLSPYEPILYESGGMSSPSLGLYFGGAQVGEHLVEPVDAGNKNYLLGLDPLTGNERWRVDANAEYLFDPWIVGDRLIQHHVDTAVTLDAATGSLTRRHTAGSGCVIDDEYVTITKTGQRHAVIATRLGRDQARVIAEPFEPVGHGAHYLRLHGCGRYRDRLVFSLDVATYGHETHADRSLVVVVDHAGKVVHTIELPYDMHWSGGTGSFDEKLPRHAPLSGELTRFAPYLQVPLGSVAKRDRLIMLDLEQGKLAWTGPTDPDTIHSSLFQVDSLWYWVQRRGLVSVFDGKTGHLRSSTLAQHRRGVGSLGPMHIRDGRVWMHTGEWTRVDEPPIAVFDATLFPLAIQSGDFSDVTAEVRRYLESR